MLLYKKQTQVHLPTLAPSSFKMSVMDIPSCLKLNLFVFNFVSNSNTGVIHFILK